MKKRGKNWKKHMENSFVNYFSSIEVYRINAQYLNKTDDNNMNPTKKQMHHN